LSRQRTGENIKSNIQYSYQGRGQERISKVIYSTLIKEEDREDHQKLLHFYQGRQQEGISKEYTLTEEEDRKEYLKEYLSIFP
jgi:hypothetical protein